MPWPPQVEDLKADLKIAPSDTRDDADLQTDLDAAVAHVETMLAGDYNFTTATTGAVALLPVPTPDVVKGTIRLAARWNDRRRSPTGTIDAGEFGNTRIPTTDADIERMLGIGRYRRPMVL